MTFEIVSKMGSIFLGAALTVGISYLLGRAVLSRLPRVEEELTAAEHVLFSFVVGTACLSGIVFILCSTSLFYDVSVWVILLFSICVVRIWARRLPKHHSAFFNPFPAFWSVFLAVVGLLYGGLYLIHAMAPEIRPDGVTYHLGLVRRYYGAHGFPIITTNIYAYLSQGMEMLYLFSYAVGRHSAAKLVHCCMLFGGAGAMLLFARRFQVWPAGVLGATLYVCTPVVGAVATSTYNGCALALFQFVTVYALFLWWKKRQDEWLLILGILSGFCFSIKYTGYFAIPLVLIVVAWGSWSRLKQLDIVFRRLLIAGFCASVFVAPWLIKNMLLVDNPVAPFYNRVFPNPYVTASFEDTFRSYLVDYSHNDTVTSWVEYALELTSRGVRFQGLLGPVFLLTPFAFLAWRFPVGWPLLACSLVFALPWLQNAGTRFLIPALMFWSLALGLVFGSSRRSVVAIVGVLLVSTHAVTSWPSVLHMWHKYPAFRVGSEIPWKAALRIEPEEQYLTHRVDGYKIAAWLRREARPSDRIFSLDSLPEAYFDSELLVYYQGAENETLVEVLRAGVEPDFQPTRMLQISSQKDMFSAIRIVQRASHSVAQWRVSELAVYSKDGPVEPSSDWKIRTEPFPWTAERLLDGNPFTGWFSWQPMYDGMSVEVDFIKPVELNRLELVFPWNQHHMELEFFGKDQTNEWVRWGTNKTWKRLPVSLVASRAWFGEELCRRKISFFVTRLNGPFSPSALAVDQDPTAWGLREVARDELWRIYETEQCPNRSYSESEPP